MQTDFPITHNVLNEIEQVVAETAYREILSNPTKYSSTYIF